jgi:hypothetical protein
MIPAFEHSWEQLLQSIEEGRVIPVVGRGLLTITVDGKPRRVHEVFAERLADRLGVPLDETTPSLSAVASRYLAGGGEVEDISSKLKRLMSELDPLAVPDALTKLARLPFSLFVSTTFDSFLERAINQVRFAGANRAHVLAFSIESAQDIPSPLSELERPTVFHLLGRVSAVPDFAVTDEDLLEFLHALQSPTSRPVRLFDEMKRQQLLIIGCEFPDWLTRFVIRIARGKRLRDKPWNTVLADDTAAVDTGLVQFLQRFSAHPVVFPGRAADFVDALHDQWVARHGDSPAKSVAAPARDPLPADGIVFLSYASEDLTAATAIRDELERAGVDVWFDKGELEAGDDFERKIRRAIEHSSLFVPVISRHTLTPGRRVFRREWVIAQEVAELVPESRKFVVPVVIDDTSYDDDRLPRRFRALHWESLPTGRPTQAFVDTLQQLYREYQKTVAGFA